MPVQKVRDPTWMFNNRGSTHQSGAVTAQTSSMGLPKTLLPNLMTKYQGQRFFSDSQNAGDGELLHTYISPVDDRGGDAGVKPALPDELEWLFKVSLVLFAAPI